MSAPPRRWAYQHHHISVHPISSASRDLSRYPEPVISGTQSALPSECIPPSLVPIALPENPADMQDCIEALLIPFGVGVYSSSFSTCNVPHCLAILALVAARNHFLSGLSFLDFPAGSSDLVSSSQRTPSPLVELSVWPHWSSSHGFTRPAKL